MTYFKEEMKYKSWKEITVGRQCVDIVVLFFCCLVIARFVYSNGWIESFRTTIYIFAVFALFIHAVCRIRENLNKELKNIIPPICVIIVLVLPLSKTIQGILFPVITVTMSNPKFIANDNKTQYRIDLEHAIVDVDMFYTSYDYNGTHLNRMHWLKGIDYDFKNKYIQTKHDFNGGKGLPITVYDTKKDRSYGAVTEVRHTIIYQYREFLPMYYNIKKRQEEEKKQFFENFKMSDG